MTEVSTTSSDTTRPDICLFLPALHGGGAERVTLHLARGLSERPNTKVDLVVANPVGPLRKDLPAQARFVDLGARSTMGALPALVRYLRRERPRVVLAALERANLAAVWARRLARLPDTRVYLAIHNTVSVDSAHAASLRARIMPALARRFYPEADGIIAVSEGSADDLCRMTGLSRDRVQVIYNPNIFPELSQRAAEAPDHPWFAQKESPVILSVGRLAPQKDFGLLLRAFAKLKQNRGDARLVILGEGPERSSLESLAQELGISESVSLPGFVSNPFACMSRAAVYALSSRWEGLPSVLVEALACGAPVVSTDCPSGPRELLKGGRYGVLTPVGDVDALANALRQALDGNTPRPETTALEPFRFAHSIEAYARVLLGTDVKEAPGRRRGNIAAAVAAREEVRTV